MDQGDVNNFIDNDFNNLNDEDNINIYKNHHMDYQSEISSDIKVLFVLIFISIKKF
jgi:hypothetical protein